MDINLSNSVSVTIDESDAALCARFQWRLLNAAGKFYARATFGNDTVLMHRLIMSAPSGVEVDHIDGNGLNNRRCNLRLCSSKENKWNARKQSNSISRFKGVSRAGKKWAAKVSLENNTCEYLGTFTHEIDAAIAYNKRVIQLRGEFGYQNKIDRDEYRNLLLLKEREFLNGLSEIRELLRDISPCN